MNFIDIQTLKALNIKPILEAIKTSSELGRIHRKNFKPYKPGHEEALREDYDRIKIFITAAKEDNSFLMLLQSYLEKLNNITGLIASLAKGRDRLEIDELYEIKYFVFYYERIRALLSKYVIETPSLVKLDYIYKAMDPDESDSPVFYIGKGFSEQFNLLKKRRVEVLGKIESLEKDLLRQARQKIGLNSLETKVVISRSDSKLLEKFNSSSFYLLSAENFANLTYTLRQTNDISLQKKEAEELRQIIDQEQQKISTELTKYIAVRKQKLRQSLDLIGQLDFLAAKAVFSIKNNCITPNIITSSDSKDELYILKDTVNLNVKKNLTAEGIRYQPVDIIIKDKVNVLSGANMSGKSTILDSIGQMMYLTAHAIPLPCSEAHVSLVDFIYCNRQSTEDYAYHQDLSSFAREILSINNALNTNYGKGLFLLDEFAKGTNPSEGTAFFAGILDYFASGCERPKEDIVIAATHFDIAGLVENYAALYRVGGISSTNFKTISSVFNSKADLLARVKELHKYMDYQLYKIDSEELPPQAAILIADILGMNRDIIDKVKDKLPAIKRDKQNNRRKK